LLQAPWPCDSEIEDSDSEEQYTSDESENESKNDHGIKWLCNQGNIQSRHPHTKFHPSPPIV
jgi:hypothetical protein